MATVHGGNDQADQALWDTTLENILLEVMVSVKGQNGMWVAKKFSQDGWEAVVHVFVWVSRRD